MFKTIALYLFLFPSLLLAGPLVLDETILENMDYAKPIVIKKEMRAAPARNDGYIGVGLCSKTTKYIGPSNVYVESPVEASRLNDVLTSDGFFTNSYSKNNFFGVLDFKSERFYASSQGDFSQREEYFDFSDVDSTRMTMRLRGYLNVKNPRTDTFGLNTSTGALFIIAGNPVLYSSKKSPVKTMLTPQQVTRQVNFESEGLYPIEIIYYEKEDTFAYLELGRLSGTPTNSGFKFGFADKSLANLENNKVLVNGLPTKMEAMNNQDLFNTIGGVQTYQCSLCSNDAACAKDQKCMDGMCQNTATACNSNARCGSSCTACAKATDFCSDGKCVECFSDFNCTFEQVCDKTANKCIPKPPECTQDSQCALPGSTSVYVCTAGKCGIKKPECTATTDCKANEYCNGSQKCEAKPNAVSCDKDAACGLNTYCDATQHTCVVLPKGGCRADTQCTTDYKCDVANRTCVKKPVDNPNGGGQVDPTPIPEPTPGKKANGCNLNGQPLSLGASLMNVVFVLVAFRSRVRKFLNI